MDTKIAVFKGKKVRKTIHNNEWLFVVNDVVEALTDTVNAKEYIKKVRSRDPELSKGWGQIVTPKEKSRNRSISYSLFLFLQNKDIFPDRAFINVFRFG